MKNTIKQIKRFLAASLSAVMLLGLSGCSDSFLEVSNPSEISTDNFPQTMDDVLAFVTSAYGVAHDHAFMGWHWGGYSNMVLDHTLDFAYRSDDTWTGIACGDITSGNSKVTAEWASCSRCIHYTNIAIETIERYREKRALSSDMAQLDFYRGECLFLRAYYLWQFTTLYAQPDLDGVGVPVLRHSVASYKEAQTMRETTRKAYEAIIEDCQEAIGLLEGQNDKFHVDKWAAKALMAKTYFFLGDNENAKAVLEDIINNSGKTLVSYNHLRNMYNGDAAFEHPSESFFEIENIEDVGTGNGYGENPNGWWVDNSAYHWQYGSGLSMYYSHFYVNEENLITSTAYGNQYCHDRNLVRFGYTSKAPMNFLKNSKTVPTSAEAFSYTISDDSTSYYYLDKQYVQEQLDMRNRALNGNADYEKDPDPRFYIGVMVPYIDSVLARGGATVPVCQTSNLHNQKWFNLALDGSDENPEIYYGFPVRKYQYLKGKFSDIKYCTGYNIYFMRLPEIYLMYASIMKDSNPTLALEYVNKVHRRAYGQDPNAASAYDYKTLNDRTKTADETDELAHDPLNYELWAELFGEMKWWPEVRRMRLGSQEYKFYKYVRRSGIAVYDDISGKWQDRNYTMPIPTTELETNDNPNMVQTPGY